MPVLDIDRIISTSPPQFNGVQFASKPAALRQLLVAEEILTQMTTKEATIGIDVGSKYADLTKILGAYNLRCMRLDVEFRDRHGEFVLGNAGFMPFRDESLDYVVLSHVLAHIEDLTTFLSEIERILKPGGMVFILQSNRYGWWKFWGYYLRRNDRRAHWRTFDFWGIHNTLATHRLKISKMHAPYHFYLHAKHSDFFYWLDRRLEGKVPNLFALQWLITACRVSPGEGQMNFRREPNLLIRSLVTSVALVQALTLKAAELGLRLISRSSGDNETT